MKIIHIHNYAGSFAENKDIAKKLRLEEIMPNLKNNQPIILDFENVNAATQSFIHALISDTFRQFGPNIIEKISFKSCSDHVRKIITIVVEYMQEGIDSKEFD